MSTNPNHDPNTAGSQEKDQLLAHAYDGIQEYDNPLPAWWSWMFIGSIVFGIFYFLLVTAAQGKLSPEGFYERAVVADLQKRFGSLGELEATNETILKYAVDTDWLKAGQSTYQSYCVSCHNADASGKTGPNLTDSFWIHVKEPKDIADVVHNGRNGGAMPAWGQQLHPNEIVLVSSYLVSLQGSNKPGLPPQGEAVAPWTLPDQP